MRTPRMDEGSFVGGTDRPSSFWIASTVDIEQTSMEMYQLGMSAEVPSSALGFSWTPNKVCAFHGKRADYVHVGGVRAAIVSSRTWLCAEKCANWVLE